MVTVVPSVSTRMFEDVVQGQQVTICLIEVMEALGIEAVADLLDDLPYLMLLYMLKLTF
jgi:hypothetical protein